MAGCRLPLELAVDPALQIAGLRDRLQAEAFVTPE